MTEQELLDTIRDLRDCLELWVEIAEEDDMRQRDLDALDRASRALEIYGAQISETMSLLKECRDFVLRFDESDEEECLLADKVEALINKVDLTSRKELER